MGDNVGINKHRINRPPMPKSEATWGHGFTEENTLYSTFVMRKYNIRYSGF